MTRSTIVVLAALLLLLPAGASGQLSVRSTVLGGGMKVKRDNVLPMSPAVSVGTRLQLDVPTEGYSLGISPYVGVDATVMLVSQTVEEGRLVTGGDSLVVDPQPIPGTNLFKPRKVLHTVKEERITRLDRQQDLWVTGRVGVMLDAPGYPHVFGLFGLAWPRLRSDVTWPPFSGFGGKNVVGAGLGFSLAGVTVEGRYVLDRRWAQGSRSAMGIFVGSTF